MNRKVLLVTLSCLMAISLMLASCKAEVEEKAEEAAGPEVPKYGGTFNTAINTPIQGIDDAYTVTWDCFTNLLTNDELLVGDWASGPAGGGDYWPRDLFWPEYEVGCLAESWEVPDPNTIIYKIRKGVHWQDKEPVNGRELVANDVAFSINRVFSIPDSYLSVTCSGWFESAEATDQYTVIVKCKDSETTRTSMAFEYVSDCLMIVAPEVIEKYGDMRDWKNVVGTGPFILTDYVPDSSATLVRNPKFWGSDPLHPKNKLPYLDGINMLIIQDSSTRLSALRTGQIDWCGGISWDDSENLKNTVPKLQWAKELNENPFLIFMRTDKAPFNDVRIRRALQMGIDQKSIANELYGGDAEIAAFPEPPVVKKYLYYGESLDEQPESIRELFEYNPEKAKELIAEAGYPNGFKTSVVCPNFPVYVDLLSLVKDYWADIGVDLQLDAKEWGVFSSTMVTKGHEQMIYSYACGLSLPHKFLEAKPGAVFNLSMVDDPYMKERRAQVWAWENMENQALKTKLVHEMSQHFLEQAYVIQLPCSYTYFAWWPWVQNYHGEYSVGSINQYNFPRWIWLDANLKKSMGY
jgi:peptide/nickel transport system substrate-binding protein